MPKRQRGTPRRGNDRNTRAEGQIPLSAQANNNGSDLEILAEVQRIISDWEDELSGALGVAGCTVEHRQNYWIFKSLLMHLVLHFNPLVPPAPAPPPQLEPVHQATAPHGPQAPPSSHAVPATSSAPSPCTIPQPQCRSSTSPICKFSST